MATAAPARPFTRFKVNPVTPHIGAEIVGVDLSGDIPDELIAEIRAALLTYKVIFFRDQRISEEQHIAFARRFGPLEIHPSTPKDAVNPEIWRLYAGPETTRGANNWHSDLTWHPTPSLGSILLGRKVPECGGDTLWCDMNAAYEGLSPAMKDWVCTLTAEHDFAKGFSSVMGQSVEELRKQIPPQTHPVVRTHPETGQRILYVNTAFTTKIHGLAPAESEWLLEHLYAQATVPEYQVRFRWREGSMAFWDNRAVQHYASFDYSPAVRNMDRVTITGDKVFFDPDR